MKFTAFLPILIWIPFIIFCSYTYKNNVGMKKQDLLFYKVSFSVLIYVILFFISIIIMSTCLSDNPNTYLIISECISTIILAIIAYYQSKIYFFNNHIFMGKVIKYSEIDKVEITQKRFSTYTIRLIKDDDDIIFFRVLDNDKDDIIEMLTSKIDCLKASE